VAFEDRGPDRTGVLTALISIEDLGATVTLYCLFQRLHTETGILRGRQPLGEGFSGIPLHGGSQVQKAVGQADIGYVHTPGPVGLINMKIT